MSLTLISVEDGISFRILCTCRTSSRVSISWRRKEWFEQIFVDFGPPGSPNHIETLTLQEISHHDPWHDPNAPVVLYTGSDGKPMLDRIKDFLPKFDYLFVTPAPSEALDITDAGARNRHINSSIVGAQLFIDYLRDRNITVPIHWYIEPEAHLESFATFDDSEPVLNYKEYISRYVDLMTNVSADNNLNAPEFLWSPYISGYPSRSLLRRKIIEKLNWLLRSEPRLRWLHVQDGVGGRSRKDSTRSISYSVTSEQVIHYYNNILLPAASGTALKSNCINMEFYITDRNGDPLPGDIHEQELRQSAYAQANIPLGVCFEIGYWYGSKYYRIVPKVTGWDTDKAVSTLQSIGFTVELFGSNLNTNILTQEPPEGTYLHKAASVKLTAEDIVKEPSIRFFDSTTADGLILSAGLVPKGTGSGPL